MKNRSKLEDEILGRDNFFLLEKYILFRRIESFKIIESISPEKSLVYALDALERNLLIKRIRLDPGLKLEILSKIDQDPKIIRKFIRDILNLLDKKYTLKKFDNSSFFDEEFFDSYKKSLKIKHIQEPGKIGLFSTPFIENNNKTKLFFQIWQDFKNKGMLSEAISTESMLIEFIIGEYSFDVLYKTSSYERPQNTILYYLKATSNMVENIDFFVIDHLDAHRNNIIFTEEISQIINSFKFKNLNLKIEEVIAHIKDIYNKSYILEENQVRSDLYIILSIIYFESLNNSEKINLLNQWFGFKKVLQKISINPELFSHRDLIEIFPILYKNGLIPLLEPYIHKLISHIINDDSVEKNNFYLVVLLKFFSYGIIEIGRFNDVNKILFDFKDKLPVIEYLLDTTQEDDVILKILKHFYENKKETIELLFLIGELTTILKNKSIFTRVIKTYEAIIDKTTDKYEKSKYLVQLSILHMKTENFFEELTVLKKITINLDIIMSESKFNPFEIFDMLSPLNVKESNTQLNEVLKNISNADFLKKDLILPISYEQYLIYAEIRKKIMENNVDIMKFLISNEIQQRNKYSFLSRISQIISEFDLAIIYANIGKKYTTWLDEPEEWRILMENFAFPYYYLKNYEKFEFYLLNALKYCPDDVYYNKYLFFIYLNKKDYDLAFNQLSICYKSFNMKKKGKTFYYNLKDLYQKIMFLFKRDEFPYVINNIFSVNDYVSLDEETKCEFYIDIGNAIADIGFLELAIEYYQKAIVLTRNIHLKATIQNNIGSIYIDLQDFKKAIPYIEDALKNDNLNYIFYENLAKIYYINDDYVKSKEIYGMAEKLFIKNNMEKEKELMKFGSIRMDLIIRNTININNVKSQNAKRHFLTAQEFILKSNNLRYLNNNTGPIFNLLSNGLDCMLHESLTIPIISKLKDKYGVKIKKKVLNQFPQAIKSALKGLHISLGQWVYLIEDLQNKHTNIIQHIKKAIPQGITDKDLSEIKRVTSYFKNIRNSAAHGGLITTEIYIQNIPEWLKDINLIISIISKI